MERVRSQFQSALGKLFKVTLRYLKWNILSNNHVLIPRDIQKEQKHKRMNGFISGDDLSDRSLHYF